MNKEHQLKKARDILLKHQGKKNQIKSKKIAEKLGIFEDDTKAQTRALLFQCAEKYELPLAADQGGYFLIDSDEEYEKYMEDLEKRKKGIEKREKLITKNYKSKK